ncbi:MAG: NAD-dependent epimerase/dehydratase family protein [Phycisphaerae bacterium]
MRALVTGGAGFIGSNLAMALVDESHDVTILDNFSAGNFSNLVKFKGDVICSDCTVQPPGPFDIIFHQASITDTTVTDQHRMMTNNVEGFRHVLSWAVAWKARVVWASSAAVYGNSSPPMVESAPPHPLNVYGYSKMVMEHLARLWHRQTGLPCIGLRYFNVFGPGEGHKGKFASMIHQLAQQMKAGHRPRIFRDGHQKRDFVWIDDVIQANLKAAEASGGEIFNVGSGISESFNAVIGALNVVMHTNFEPEYIENPYHFFQKHTEADLAKSMAVLGYTPKAGLLDGIREYYGSGAL